MDFGLFNTWNALYEDGKVPWDPNYSGGKLLEEEAYVKNFKEIDAVEDMGWDYLWLGGDPECLDALLVVQQSYCPGPVGTPHAPFEAECVEYLAQRFPDVRVGEWLVRQGTGSGNLD